MPNTLRPAVDRETPPLTALRSALDALDAPRTDPDGVRQAIAEGAVRLTRAEGALLALNEDGERRVAAMFPWFGSDPAEEEWRETARELAEKALRLRRPVAAGAVAAAPLEWANEVLGSLAVTRDTAAPAFDDADLTALSLYCSHAAVVLDNARLRAERAQTRQEQDEFVSVISHEFRTPLTSIKGFAQLVARRLGQGADEGLIGALRTIDNQATRLARLASDVALSSRVESGRIQMEKQPGDLLCLLRDCRAAMLPVAGNRDLILDLPEYLPQMAFDPNRLRQVVMNLLDNAVKYSPDGTAIRVTVRLIEGAALLSVQDEGIGLAAEEQRSVFKRFSRTDRAAALHEGAGLGLTIAKGIVVAHEGRIWVESVPDEGSTFFVTLPIPGPTL